MVNPTSQAPSCQNPVNALRWLSGRRQWVAWRYLERAGKRTKPPVNPHTGKDADVSDPTTWGSYDDALARASQDQLPGIGYVLSVDDGLAGVDLDGCIDDAGNLAPWAASIVAALDSYTETSPSGRGLHILAWGTLPPGKRRAGPVEMYECNRYLTFTGAFYDWRWALYERREALAAVHAQYLGGFDTPGTATQPTERRAPVGPAAASTGPALDDLAIVDKLFRSRAAPRIAKLWTGDTSDYATPSEGDLALASFLAFYSQDPAQIRRLLAMSGLGTRGKWQRDDYALATIQRAIATRAGTYDPAWRSTS